MDNSRSDNFPVSPWDGNSNWSGDPIFYLDARGNNQQPWLLSGHYTNLAGGHGQDINLTGIKTIIHPHATVPRPSSYLPPYARDRGRFYSRSSQDSTMIRSHLSSDSRPGESQYAGMYPVLPGPCDPQSVPGSMLGHMQLPERLPGVTPWFLKDRAINSTTTVSAQKRPAHYAHWLCPICSVLLGRAQDRRRHILSHLPRWLHCPDPGCSWRGDRWENLNKHWYNVHPSCKELDKSNSIIYNPWPLVQGIIEGKTSIEDARVIAISIVETRASGLGKSRLWGDLWGRKGRKARRL